MVSASEIGLIAKLDPQVDDDGVKNARKEVEDGVTQDPLEVGVEVDKSNLDEAYERIQEIQDHELDTHDPSTGRKIPDRYQRQRKINRKKKEVKDKAKRVGGTAKEGGIRGGKFLGKVAAAKTMRKLGIPATVPQNQLLETMMPSSGGSGVGPSGSGEGGSSATEPDQIVPLLQSQLEIQEEMLDLMEMNGSGGSGSGGEGGGSSLLSSLGIAKSSSSALFGGIGAKAASKLPSLGALPSLSGILSGVSLTGAAGLGALGIGSGALLADQYMGHSRGEVRRNVGGGIPSMFKHSIGSRVNWEPPEWQGLSGMMEGMNTSGSISVQTPQILRDIQNGNLSLSGDFWPNTPQIIDDISSGNFTLQENFWPDPAQTINDIANGEFTLSESFWPNTPGTIDDIINGDFELSGSFWPETPQVITDINNGDFRLTESFWPSKPGWFDKLMEYAGMGGGSNGNEQNSSNIFSDITNGDFQLKEDFWPSPGETANDIVNGDFSLNGGNGNEDSDTQTQSGQETVENRDASYSRTGGDSSTSDTSEASENRASENSAQVNNTFRFDISLPANAATTGLDEQTKRQVHEEIDRRFRELERRASV